MPRLIRQEHHSVGRTYEFEHDIVIGRAPQIDFTILDVTVSREHATVKRIGDSFYIRDLDSVNGTFVNGAPVAESLLADGDTVRLGSVSLRFEVSPTDTQTGPVIVHESPVSAVQPEDHPDETELSVLRVQDALLGPIHSQSTRQRLEVIYAITHAMSQTLDEDSLLRLILEKLFTVFPQAGLGFIMVRDGAGEEMTRRVSLDRHGHAAEVTVSRSILDRVVDEKQGIFIRDAVSDDSYSASQSIVKLRFRSVLCVPIMANEEVLGVLQLNAPDRRAPFAEDDLALLLGIAGQAGMFLWNARLHGTILEHELLEQDLELATKIQAHFLPTQPPEIPDYALEVSYTASMKVSGDCYDFLELADGRIGVLVGDVSGKGVSAALCMAKLSSEARYRAAGQSSPGQILRYLNESVSRDFSQGMFVTMAFIALEVETGGLTVASAGHMAPLLRRANGRVFDLVSDTSVPLGVLEDATYDEATYRMEPGDAVVMYTDGVTEATNARNEEFGAARLAKAMQDSEAHTPRALTEEILREIEAFLGDQPQNDDITLVALTRNPVGP